MEEEIQEKCAITFCRNAICYLCNRCKKAYYCSESHQRLHWRSGHKIQCITAQQKQRQNAKLAKQKLDDRIQNKRKYFRKSFVNSYATSKQQDYLALASILQDAQMTHFNSSQNPTDDDIFDYGFTVCLVIKSLYLLGHLQAAKKKITQYLRGNHAFIHEKKYKRVQQQMSKQQQQQIYGYMQKKLQLISILANLSYAIGMDYNYLYVVYSDHIYHMTKPDSAEMSNVYFFMGSAYAHQGFLLKAMACFWQSAKIRGEDAQHCFYNIGILCFWLGRTNDAITFFNKSFQIRQVNCGETSNQVAQVYQNLGKIYMNVFDFHTAQHYYLKAIQNRASNCDRTSRQYQDAKEAIQNLFKKLCAYIQNEPSEHQKPETYVALREVMLINKKYPYDILQSFKKIASNSAKFDVPYLWKYQFNQRKHNTMFKPDVDKFYKQDPETISLIQRQKKTAHKKKVQRKKIAVIQKKQEFLLVISNKIMSMINAAQVKLAKQLQERLSFIVEQKNAVAEIQKSQFIASLTAEQLQIFRKNNEKIYSSYLIDFPQLIQQKNKIKVAQLDTNNQSNFKQNVSINWYKLSRAQINN